jgi:hypothetical protein
MKNLIKAIESEQKKRLNDFILSINQVTDLQSLDVWQYRDLLPKGKKMSYFKSLKEAITYLISRKQKAIYKQIEREVNEVTTVFNAGTLIECKISMEWKNNRTWGANPTAECWYSYTDINGNYASNYVKSGSIGGCGYDKGSTAVAECLNQINEVLKPLYVKKNKVMATDKRENRDTLGYGSGYGILPRIEGGVGVSCYPAIFEGIGYKFSTTASGKTFDVYHITKLTKNN